MISEGGGKQPNLFFPARLQQFLPFVLVFAGAVAAVAAYLQALDYPFISDDHVYITQNAKLLGLNLAELWRLFLEPYNEFEFLPLRDLSYRIDIALFGMNPSAFRMHNILLYLLCLPLVYGVTLRLWHYFRPADSRSAPWAAAATTVLFALHPAHVEAVVWISGHKDVLSALFSLLAIWFAVRARQEMGLSPLHAVASLAALSAAMLSKATSVAVAPFIALLWVFFLSDIPPSSRRRVLLLWPIASLLLAICIALVFASSSTVKMHIYFEFSTMTRVLAVLGWMARLSVSPESRHYIYRVFEDPYFPAMVALGAGMLAMGAAGMAAILRKRSLEAFSVVVFLMLCLPYTQLIPFRTVSLVSDRFLTLALWPATLLIVALSWRLNTVARAALLLAFALTWCYQTIERPREWRDQDVLTDADLRAYHGYYLPALQKVLAKMEKESFSEAREAAGNISAVEVQNVVIKLVDAAIAVNGARKTGDPNDAAARLQELALLLEEPPAQTRWDPSMFYFWETCQNAFALNWKWLVVDFPNDTSLYDRSRLSLMSIMKNKKYANY